MQLTSKVVKKDQKSSFYFLPRLNLNAWKALFIFVALSIKDILKDFF